MKLKRVLAWMMMGCLLLTMTACGTKSGGAYTIVSTLTEGSYAIGFRNDDTTGDYVLAALKVLAAEGKIDELDVRWFGKEVSRFESDKNALKDMEKPEARTLIMGLNPDNFPMSYREGSKYQGYDVELAQQVCAKLGWKLKYQEIADESTAYVELSSGNVDCVWGGMLLDSGETLFRVVSPYMDGGVVLVTVSGKHLGSMRRLKGKTIGMNDAPKYADALSKTELSTTAGAIKLTNAGNEKVFDALYQGKYDAIVTDYAAALYYMR